MNTIYNPCQESRKSKPYLMRTISGTHISQTYQSKLEQQVTRLRQQGITPCLAVIIVGNIAASRLYVNKKRDMCTRLGIESRELALPESVSKDTLLTHIAALNQDPKVHGILCQLPLPQHISETAVICAIRAEKDVDCFHPHNIGLLMLGRPRFVPCTPMGILRLLEHEGIGLGGKRVVIIGRSNIVGRPLALLLSSRGIDATVTLCHSLTKDIASESRRADIIIVAIGQAERIGAEYISPGAVVIDVGINRIPADTPRGFRIVGDVRWSAAQERASAATPVPGGVGPMTILTLMENTITATKQQAQPAD